eukprot:3110870-Rhodomonas_salina.1
MKGLERERELGEREAARHRKLLGSLGPRDPLKTLHGGQSRICTTLGRGREVGREREKEKRREVEEGGERNLEGLLDMLLGR